MIINCWDYEESINCPSVTTSVINYEKLNHRLWECIVIDMCENRFSINWQSWKIKVNVYNNGESIGVRTWRKRREISSSVKLARFAERGEVRQVRFSISSRFFKFCPSYTCTAIRIFRCQLKQKLKTHGETGNFVHKRKQFLTLSR